LETLGRSNQPWCVFCGLIGPHDPYLIPQRYLDQYPLDSIPLPVSYFDHLSDKPRIYKRIRNQLFDQLGEHEVREAIRHYWAYCTYLDDLFGQILQRLEETGQVENTLVIYCADHGDYCGEHGLFAKGIPCFQGAYRVPNIMRWPAGIKDPGRRVDSFASLVDFSPTLLEVAGMLTETNSISRSLAPFFSHELPVVWRNAVYTQCNGVELYYSQRSVMTQEFKYTFNGFDLDELYDLRTDPDEMQNINDDPIYLEVKKDLLRQMWQFAYQTGDTMINPYITVGIAPWGPGVAFR